MSFAFLCVGLSLLLGANVAKAAERPNIVLILCDDLGYADVGFNGAQDIQTPHLDQLAKAGTIFSSAYVCHPFCGPSRMGLMTGRYPHSFGAPFNLPNSGQGIEDYNRLGVPTDEKLISSVLRDAGYFTGAIGKWHMGIDSPYHPNTRGFDDFYGFLGGGHAYFPAQFDPIYQRQVKSGKAFINDYVVPLQHNGNIVQETEYITDAISREASRFVKQAADGSKPFFLYVAYNAPHTPLEAKEEDLAVFAEIEDDTRRTYAAMVYAVDRGVGQLVQSLKTTGALDDTLVIFMSDNGGKLGRGANNGRLKEGKGSVSEGGIRVPMFFHWPGKVKAATRYEHPVTALDFYPTFAKLAGAAIAPTKKLDGTDIWTALQTGVSPRRNQSIFAMRHWAGFHDVGIRQGQWKATKQRATARWRLFNLDDDVSETTDLSDQHPSIVTNMIKAAALWSQSHQSPQWFDDKASEKRWHEQGLPDYESTFTPD